VDPTPILPASCLVAPMVWELEVDIERMLLTEPTPTQCPDVRSVYCPRLFSLLGPPRLVTLASVGRCAVLVGSPDGPL
jgi:hypothetical protein